MQYLNIYFIKYIFKIKRLLVKVSKYLMRRVDKNTFLLKAHNEFEVAVLFGGINDFMSKAGYEIPVSFRNELNARSYRDQYNRAATPEWILNDKIVANKFSDKLGLKRPINLQNGVPYNELKFIDKTIIKPVSGAGSKGVYKFINRSSIYDLKNGMKISFKKMKSELKTIDKKFITEELVLSSNNKIRDYKFFSFYGEIPVILEIERTPRL